MFKLQPSSYVKIEIFNVDLYDMIDQHSVNIFRFTDL